MTESVHVDDEGTVIYVDVNDQAVSLDEDLDTFTTRIIRIKRPNDATLIIITGVPTEVDTDDSIKKLKLSLGTDVGTALTGLGLFKVPSTEIGDWVAEVLLAKVAGTWTSDPFIMFKLRRNLS